MTTFSDSLAAAVRRCGNPVMVGLDPRYDLLPAPLVRDLSASNLAGRADACRVFCQGVIDVVAPLVPVVKPQAAFFEQFGPAGMAALADVARYARQRNLLVVLDGKRGDIGSTATAYAAAYLGESSAWGADALTVNPYLGGDSLEPFVDAAAKNDAGIFVLVKTSNPGGGMFQDLLADGRPLYRHVAQHVAELAAGSVGDCGYGSVGAVVGATYPRQLAELRDAMPCAWILVPGFGSQGAGAGDVAPAFDARGMGAVINSSRGIIFAHARPEYHETFGPERWQDAVAAATQDMINQLRDATSAGKLPAP